jgi:hypothetical protein
MTADEKRELTRRLAERVMGWQFERGLLGLTHMHQRADGTYLYCFLWDESSPYVAKHEGWNPLENIADAWMLVEAVAKRTKWWELSRRPTGVCANFTGSPKDNHYGADVCEAICLAADRAADQWRDAGAVAAESGRTNG